MGLFIIIQVGIVLFTFQLRNGPLRFIGTFQLSDENSRKHVWFFSESICAATSFTLCFRWLILSGCLYWMIWSISPQNQNSNGGRSELHESFTKCWISFAHARIHLSPVLHSSRIMEFPNDVYEFCQIEVILLPTNHPKLLTSLVKWSAAYLWTIHIYFALKKSYLPVFQRFSFLPFVQIQLI